MAVGIDSHSLHEEYEGHDEDSSINDMPVFIALAKVFSFLVPSLLHDLFVEFIARLQPFEAVGAG